jgi:hypothetical protein
MFCASVDVYERLIQKGKKPGFFQLLATQTVSAVWHVSIISSLCHPDSPEYFCYLFLLFVPLFLMFLRQFNILANVSGCLWHLLIVPMFLGF